MSEFHTSPSGHHASIPTADEEAELTDAQRSTLRVGLEYAPLPRPQADFNAAVLAAVQSGQDFEPLAEQAKTRLRWAALPAVIGFILMYGVACWQAHSLPRPPAPYPRVNHTQPAPPLPDLPTLSPSGKSASAKSAFSNGGSEAKNASQSAADSTSLNAVTAMGGPHHDR